MYNLYGQSFHGLVAKVMEYPCRLNIHFEQSELHLSEFGGISHGPCDLYMCLFHT